MGGFSILLHFRYDVMRNLTSSIELNESGVRSVDRLSKRHLERVTVTVIV